MISSQRVVASNTDFAQGSHVLVNNEFVFTVL
jgi:hypothetical protein